MEDRKFDTELIVTRTFADGDGLQKQSVRFTAQTTGADLALLLLIEQAINDSVFTGLRARVNQ